MEATSIGGVTIARIDEWEASFPLSPGQFFQGYDQDAWDDNAEWLAPSHWDAENDHIRACVQPWLVRSEGKNILVDTGLGNDKDRPNVPIFGGLETPFLQRLAEAGAKPADIDVVVCTHIHVDHVGWNTQLVDGNWVPTFPNARYLFPKADWEYWNPENDSRYTRVGDGINAGMFEDSVRPIAKEGLCEFYEDQYQIDENLILRAAPGHTPGHSVVEITSEGEHAVIAGDVMHSPMQIFRPNWNSPFCEHAGNARETRRTLLQWCADNRALLVPAHFAGGHAVWVKREGSRFAIDRWAEFTASSPDVRPDSSH